MVERTYEGSVVRLYRCMVGVDARCVRFHRVPADHAGDRAVFRRIDAASDLRVHDHFVDASPGCHRVRLAGRSDRPQDTADDRDPRLFAVQLRRGPGADLHFPVRCPRHPRLLHGRGMARRLGAGDGNLAAAFARLHGRGAARLLGHRLPDVVRDLRSVLHVDRLARDADRWRAAGPGGRLCAHLRQGARGLGGESPPATPRQPRGQGAAVQHLQAQHAAPTP